MALLDFDFDPTTVEGSKYGLLPVGEYIAEITNSDYKVTKNGLGKYIELEFTILDGDYVGRKFWDRLNVIHENKQAQDIANATLKDILSAIGHSGYLRDTSNLHNRPLKMKISITTRKGSGEEQNSARYSGINKSAPAPAPAARAAAPTAAPAASAAPAGAKPKPWERK